MKTRTAILLLENGTHFTGESFGATGTTGGEVCFNTSMTGYQEILTDPSYKGQMVTMTAPQIGNYGVNPEDVESSKIQVQGFIIREASPIFSNHRATQSLDDYLKESGIVGIQGIDTRALTRIIRDEGAMNAVISSETDDLEIMRQQLTTVPDMNGQDLVKEVTCSDSWEWSERKTDDKFHVVTMDFGVKFNILRQLQKQGCHLSIVPAHTSAEEILAHAPDGIFLSNGPGDPEAVDYAIKTVRNLVGVKPIFGICLGHQILSLSQGAKTFKLKFGHRGGNHPVRNVDTGAVEITSQNHGFAVDPESLPPWLRITHVNLNDGTLEGIESINKFAFSVQYHPEASPGPHDSRYLFKKFIDLMELHAQKN